jgi:hypothetical protein
MPEQHAPEDLARALMFLINTDTPPLTVIEMAIREGQTEVIANLADVEAGQLFDTFKEMWDRTVWARTFAILPEHHVRDWLARFHVEARISMSQIRRPQ